MSKLFHVNHESQTTDVALLISRVILGSTLFNFSGVPKLLHFASQGDPLHIGSLAGVAMAYAAFALGVCTLMVLFGLATRFAASFTTISLAATFFIIDHSLSSNLRDPGHNSHPEATWLYMTAYLVLVFTGPGRYSLDALLSRASASDRHAPALGS